MRNKDTDATRQSSQTHVRPVGVDRVVEVPAVEGLVVEVQVEADLAEAGPVVAVPQAATLPAAPSHRSPHHARA